jgi:hypothetical protein
MTYYDIGALVTVMAALYTIRWLPVDTKAKADLGIIFAFGILLWPILLFFLIKLNVERPEIDDRQENR